MIPVVDDLARVVACAPLGDYTVLTLHSFAIAQGARPGQFITIATDQLLRRPFSVYRIDRGAGTLAVAFDAIGDGTRWLAAREPGDVVRVVGPLGHGYEIGAPDGGDLVVGGGYGAAAVAGLADALADRGRAVHAILGARTANRIFRDDLLDRSCETVTVTTDDGSAGARGVVTDVLGEVVRAHGITTVYACGPNQMLRAVSESCGTLGVRAQLAVEEFMACGIGVCWTCVFPVRVNGTVSHLRSCTEGPVFAGASIAWP